MPPRAAEGTSPLKAPMARGGFPGPPLLTPEPCRFSEDTAGGGGGSWGTQSPAPASGIRVEHTCPSVPAPLADDRMCRKTVDNHKKGLDFHENRLFQPPERFLWKYNMPLSINRTDGCQEFTFLFPSIEAKDVHGIRRKMGEG